MPSYYSGTTMTLDQVARVAYQAGARGSDLEFLTAVPTRESKVNADGTLVDPGAHRTDSTRERLSGDRGLWQINSTWDAQLIQAGIIRQASDLFDPVTNARAAIYVLGKQGRDAWAMATSGKSAYQSGGDPMRGLNLRAAQQAVRTATQQGTIGQDWNQGSTTGAAAAGGGGGAGGSGQVALPPDVRLVAVGGADPWALFHLGGGVWIGYSNVGAENLNRPIQRLSRQQFDNTYGNFVRGGRAEELTPIPAAHGTFANFWNSTMSQVMSKSNPARNDPSVMRVLAEYAARPDMSEAELQNRLRDTEWWRTHTQSELAWNSLSLAEQQVQRLDAMGKMVNAWQQFTGENIALKDSRITQFREQVASGKITLGSWVESYVKPRAADNPESPWSRQLRSEVEEQRRRGVDIENTANQVRQTLERWGLTWGEQAIHGWARNLVERKRSDDDLMGAVRKQAKALYPWKDEMVETVTAATPWLEVYNSTMEKHGSLQTPEIKRALQRGVTAADFEVQLRKSPAWAETANGQGEMEAAVRQFGELVGYE